MKFRHSLIGYKTAQVDNLLIEEEKAHQAALAEKQSQLQQLLTYQQQLQRQQIILDQMLRKARTRSEVFDTFSESLQQYFGRSEQRNAQEIQHCREAADQLETEIKQQGDKVESDIIALETFLASVEKHLGDLVTSLGEEFQAGQALVGEYNESIQKTAPAIIDQTIDLDKLKWSPETIVEAAAVTELPFARDAEPPEIPQAAKIDDTEISLSGFSEAAAVTGGPQPEQVVETITQQSEVEAEQLTPPVADSGAKIKPRAFTTDDDPTILAILKVMLEREGFEVLQASDGREAGRMIDDIVPPDIAILDLMLPYIDGLQLTKQIRSKTDWATTPILILSSNATENEMVALLEAGADDYVIKPFNTRELIARVKRLSEVPAK